MKKNILTKKLIDLDLSILDINKISMYQFWYDNIKQTGEKTRLCYRDTGNFITEIKTEYIQLNHAKMLKQDLILEIAN